MIFELKPIANDQTPRFEIEVEYEHGDSDAHNTIMTVIQGKDFNDLEKYINKFEKISKDIKDNRQSSKPFPEEYQDVFDSWDFNFKIEDLDVWIELERDVKCNDEMLMYFADMSIMKIIYYDENNNKSTVHWKN